MVSTGKIKRIAFVGNYLPRQCGIATFTTDLCESFAAAYFGTTCIALPVNDTEAGYTYPPRVRFELTEKDIRSYHRAADFLNINNVDLVCLQHAVFTIPNYHEGYTIDDNARALMVSVLPKSITRKNHDKTSSECI